MADSISMSAAVEVMDRALGDIRREMRSISTEYAILPEGAADAVDLAEKALEELEGDLRRAVLGDGGVHGSQERAFEVWVDLAVDTTNNLRRAQGYAEDYSLSGYLKKAGVVVREAAANVVVGATGIVTTLLLALLAYAFLSRGRR